MRILTGTKFLSTSLKGKSMHKCLSFFRKHKLRLPESVPEAMKNLFYACYAWDPGDRPTFEEMDRAPYYLHGIKFAQEFAQMSVHEFESIFESWREEVARTIAEDFHAETTETTLDSSFIKVDNSLSE